MGAFDSIPSSGSSNTVGISIRVVDDNSAAVVQKVEQNLNSLAGAGKNASAGVGEAAAATGRLTQTAQAAAGAMSQLGLSGTGLGRATQHAQLLAEAIELLPGYLTAAGIGIGIVGAGLFYAWQQWRDIRDLANEYNQKVQQVAEAKLIDTASLETAVGLLRSANDQVTQLEQKKQEAGATSFLGLLGGYIAKFGQGTHPLTGTGSGGNIPLFTAHNQQELNDAKKDTLETTLRLEQAQHELNIEQIKSVHAVDAALPKHAQIEAHLKEQLAINKENLRSHQEMTKTLAEAAHKPFDPQDQVELTNAKNTVALGQAMAQRTNLARQDAQDALHTAQQATRELEQFQDKLRAAIAAREHAQAGGLGGVAGIEANRQASLDAINGSKDPDVVKVQQRVAVNQNADNLIAQSRERFEARVQSLSRASDNFMMQGYARIESQTQQHLAQLDQAYLEFYGRDRSAWQGYQDAKTAIQQDADNQRALLAQRTDEQISQIEAQAARVSLPQWQQGRQAILDQYTQRVRAAKQALDQQAINEEQYNRLTQALGAQTQAELQRQAQQTRDRLAGELQSFFDSPAKYMENRAKEMMFKILANWVQQLSQAQGPIGNMLQQLFGMGPDLPTNAGLGGIFGKGGGQRSAWDERIPGVGSTASVAPLATAGTTLTAAGTTLTSSATQLNLAATSLTQAALSMQSAGAGGAALGGIDLGGSGSSGGLGGILNNIPGLGGGNSATSIQSGGGGLGSILGNIPGLGGGGAEQLNGGGFQPTDIIGAVPDIGIPGSTEVGSSGASSGGSSAGSMTGGFISGGLQAGMGIYSALKSGNALQGALQVGMAGLQIGMMFGPLGAAIGGIVGAVGGLLAGIFGDHGLAKAKQYDQQTVKPRLTADIWGVSGGQMDYGAAESDLTGLYSDSQKTTKQFGSAAVKYFNSTIGPEINAAIQEVKRQQASGRNEKVTWGAAQFDSGGFISGFGDMATGPYTGFIHARLGERVMNPAASVTHGPMLDAMNTGSYARSQQRMPVINSGGGNGAGATINLHAMDPKSFSYWLRNGGARLIQQHLNGNTGQYAGVALG